MKLKKILVMCLTILLTLQVSPFVFAESGYSVPALNEIRPNDEKMTVEQLIEKLPKSASIDDPFLILVNRENLLEGEPYIPFTYSDSGLPYHEALATPLSEFRQAAAEEGYYYNFISGYRSTFEQAANREFRFNSYLSEGLSEADAQYWTDLFYAPAFGSEHTTGLAVDLVDTQWYGDLTTDMYWQPAMQWLANNAHHYGFILRYLEGKTDITGINFEPWHLRYVGYENAQFMTEYNLTLEEYIALIIERDKVN